MAQQKRKVLFLTDSQDTYRVVHGWIAQGTLVGNDELVYVNRQEPLPEWAMTAEWGWCLVDGTSLADGGLALVTAVAHHLPHAAIIALLDPAQESAAEGLLQAGAHDYLLKGQFTASLFQRVLLYTQQQKQLLGQADQKRFEILAQHLPHLVFIYDAVQNRIAYTNRPDFFGHSLLGSNVVQLFDSLIWEEDRHALLSHWQAVLRGETNTPIEWRMRSSVGKWEWVQSRYTILSHTPDGNLHEMLVTVNILTQQRQVEGTLQQYAERLELFYEIDQAILKAREPDQIAKIALDYIQRLLPVAQASVVAFDFEAEMAKVLAIAVEKVPLQDLSFPLHIMLGMDEIQKGNVYRLESIASQRHQIGTRYLLPAVAIQTAVILPLVAQDELIGSLNLGGLEPGVFHDEALKPVRQVADSVGIAIQQANLNQQAKARTQELEALTNLSAALRVTQLVSEILPLVLERVTAVIGGVSGSIFLIDPQDGDLVARGTYPPDPHMEMRRRKVGSGITGRVAATGHMFISEDLTQDTMAHMIIREVDQLQQVRSCIALPLRTQNHIVGVMHVGLPERHTFTNAEIRLLTAASEIAGTALERAMVLETLEQRVMERTEELERANQQLTKLDQLKSKFVSDVSHELRTPITNLNLYLDLLMQGKPEKQAQYMDIIRRQGARLITLIEDILNLSRLEMGQGRIAFALIDLNELIEQVSAVHHAVAEAANLQLLMELEDGLPLILAERNQLAQVITNLLNNAINYTPSGWVKIGTHWDHVSQQTYLFVSDSGMGIAPEELPHLFERFYRGDRVSQARIPGTGLGLAIVKDIVQFHGGEIQIESVINQGTTFRVYLPASTGASS